MGLDNRREAMADIEHCRVQTMPTPLPNETSGEFVVDCSLEFWMIVSAKLNGEKIIEVLDEAFYDTIVREYHAKMLRVASNFAIDMDIVYVTDSASAPLSKFRRKKVHATPHALRTKMYDATRPVIHASEVAAAMHHDETSVLPYLFERPVEVAEVAPDDILHQIEQRNLLSDKALNSLRGPAFSLTALCSSLNAADEVKEGRRAPQPWKRLIGDTGFRRNQIARCNERLYALILAGCLPRAHLLGMFHEHVANDGLRRRLHPSEIGEADHLISNRSLQENKVIVIVTNDSDQIVYFLLRHARRSNTVLWYENQVEGRFFHLSQLRTISIGGVNQDLEAGAMEETFRRRALAYILCGTDFTYTRVVGSPSKIGASMQQMPDFHLGSVWHDRPALVAAIERVMSANASSRKREDGAYSTADDVANNLFYKSGELFRLPASSTQ